MYLVTTRVAWTVVEIYNTINMRDLKFRAWNTIVKRFQFFDLKDIEKQKGEIQWHILNIDQYTGLRDSKGRKIYENDIVEFSEERYYTSQAVGLERKKFRSKVVYDTDTFIISETQENDTPLGVFMMYV